MSPGSLFYPFLILLFPYLDLADFSQLQRTIRILSVIKFDGSWMLNLVALSTAEFTRRKALMGACVFIPMKALLLKSIHNT